MLPPSIADLEGLAAACMAELPQEFLQAVTELVIRVEDFPAEEILDDLDIADAFELTGLYQGVPVTESGERDAADEKATIFLFRRAILDEWAERADVPLRELVNHILVHELAHHFGWTDDEIMEIDDWTQ
jgi:predicted Zn-dependent protease with MMP-like domain